MVDPVDPILGKHLVEDSVELGRRGDVVTERLLDDELGPGRQPGGAEALR